MSAERDELAKAIYDGLHHEDSDVYADAIGGDLDDVIVDGRVDLLAVADKLLAAGYRKPRVVTTAEELDALPVGSVALDSRGNAFQRVYAAEPAGLNWYSVGVRWGMAAGEIAAPATVLHEGAQP